MVDKEIEILANICISASLPPTFLPTGATIQNYPWTPPPPGQSARGLTGNSKLNYLCFLEMTDGRALPTGPRATLPINGNWTSPSSKPSSAGQALSAAGWTAQADSAQSGWEASRVLDNDPSRIWHTFYDPTAAALPHNITIDMKKPYLVSGIYYLPRQDDTLNGTIGRFQVDTSLTGTTWDYAGTSVFAPDHEPKTFVMSSARIARFVRITAQSEAQGTGSQFTSAAEIRVLSIAHPRDDWSITATSEETGNKGQTAQAAIDGDPSTFYHSEYTPAWVAGPHSLTIDQGRKTYVNGLSYLPRQDGFAYGRIGEFLIEYSNDGINWTTIKTGGGSDGQPGWPDTAEINSTSWTAIAARYFRLTSKQEAGNRFLWMTAAEIHLHDGSREISNFSSMDFATFAMSRANFFGRYLIPKLRVVNQAMEAAMYGLEAKIVLVGTFKESAEWSL